MRSMTVIYYTSNKEDKGFEKKVIETLVKNSCGLPIISVSQEPINLGKNISVGIVGASVLNAWRQLQIGALEAKTDFVCTAESDTLYPEEYFKFIPTSRDKFFIPNKCYVIFKGKRKTKSFFRKPKASEGMIIVGRDFLLKRLGQMFNGLPEWSSEKEHPKLYQNDEVEEFELDVPVVQFKTNRNMHGKVPIMRRSSLRELPVWGDCLNLIEAYQ